MKTSIQLAPSRAKIIAPIILIGGALLPVFGIGFLIRQILWIPFSHFIPFYPFVYRDKPWYATDIGGVTASLVWSIAVYLISSIRITRTKL